MATKTHLQHLRGVLSRSVEASASRRYHQLAWGLVLYTTFVILWGAFVRVTGAGAGCGDHWPLCDGEVLPTAPSTEKLIEFTHRVTSGVAWIWSLSFVVATRNKAAAPHIRRAATLSFVFMTTEALVGAGIVLTEMVADNPDVYRGFWVGGHLVNTFLLLAAVTAHAFFASHAAKQGGVLAPGRTNQTEQPRRLPSSYYLAGGAFLLASATGAIAALGDTLFPAETLASSLAADFNSASHLFVRLRWLHPVVALSTAAVIGSFAIKLVTEGGASTTRSLAGTLLLLITSQVALGLLNVLLLAPLWLQLVHLLMADAAWILFVLLALTERWRGPH